MYRDKHVTDADSRPQEAASEVSLRSALALADSRPQEEASEVSLRSALALAGSFLGYFCTVGFVNAYGVFQQYYTAHYLPTYSNFQISWIGSFQAFMVFACAPLAGVLSDRYGPTIPILIGSICQIVAVFMTSLCHEYYQLFLAQAVLLGAGMSLIAIATTTMVPLYFARNRAFAQGVSVSGSSLGGVLWPIALDRMLNKDGISFGWTMRIVGFIMTPLLALTIVFVRRPRVTVTTTDITLAESGDVRQQPKAKKKDLSSLKQPTFILLCCGLAVTYLGFFAPIFYVSIYATHLGFSENFAFYTVSILNAGSLFGRILPGPLADKYGQFNALMISAVISGLVVFCWTEATSKAGLIIWTFAYGFTSGAILSLQLACATVFVSPDCAGAAVGLALGSVSLTGLFGTPIAGQLVGKGYVALSCFAAATLMVGGFLIGAARFMRNRGLFAKV
ncbi:related to monocarboxylate transporter [Ramularia collo-cygni]|uniref:Related to monocarboxylate transporter n=1 Tax=Ramularia collo-cygni TaxID=112498 RepID=A0A2D3UUJ2_9PEZI|nr:related to monocarboxylate transporter [Ramularia collo-cygni]CZT16620.1 related to monocarboxylate transporter [Ramularia collo-cygni]